jgi:acetylornithine aminotransferase
VWHARTGKWFGFQQAVSSRTSDSGQGLAPRRRSVRLHGRRPGGRLFGPGNHGSTFGGNPLACSAALTTIEVMEQDGLLANAAAVGALIRRLFGEALAGVAGVVDIRGHGLMIGIELDRPCGALVGKALEAGLLINVTGDKIIRLLPPLIFSENDARELVDRSAPLIKDSWSLIMAIKHFLQFNDFSREELEYVFERTRWIRTSSSPTRSTGRCPTARW